mmetsp:Transcript_19832/g.26791  ORF Transcript_19832/g.26791 Transcript_19832/m.26791 type:complete len:128 (-) Transcript_19832:67-450(-)
MRLFFLREFHIDRQYHQMQYQKKHRLQHHECPRADSASVEVGILFGVQNSIAANLLVELDDERERICDCAGENESKVAHHEEPIRENAYLLEPARLPVDLDHRIAARNRQDPHRDYPVGLDHEPDLI